MNIEVNEETVMELFNYYISKNNMFLITKEQHDKYIENDKRISKAIEVLLSSYCTCEEVVKILRGERK